MDVMWAASTCKIMMNPHDIEMGDILDVFFDTITGISTMRYFNAQQIALEHRAEEQEIDQAQCEETHVVVDGDGVNPELEELQRVWMVEDAREDVAKAVSGYSNRPIARVVKVFPS